MIKSKIKSLIYLLFIISSLSYAQSDKEIEQLHAEFKEVMNKDAKASYDLAKKAVKASRNTANKKLKLQSYKNISEIEYTLVYYDAAKQNTNVALALAIELNDEVSMASMYYRLGGIATAEADYSQALKYHQEGLRIADKLQIKSLQFHGHYYLSRLYNATHDNIGKFKEIYRALDLAKQDNDTINITSSYNFLTYLYLTRDADSAYMYSKRAYDYIKETNNNQLKVTVLNYQYFALINNEDKLSEAEEVLLEQKRIAKELNNEALSYGIDIGLGHIYEKQKKYGKAIKAYEDIGKNYDINLENANRARLYYTMSGAYEHSGDYKKAYEILDYYIRIKDSLFDLKKSKEFDIIRTEFDVEKKDAQIVLLEKEKELEAVRKKWILAGTAAIVLFLGGVLLLYRQRIRTQKLIRVKEAALYESEKKQLQQEQELIQVQSLVEGQDKERNRIAKELHDGIGGSLASINLNLSHINTVKKDEELATVSDTLRDTIKDLRSLSHSLSTNYIQHKPFEFLLAELQQQYKTAKAFDMEISIFPEDCLQGLSITIKHHLYRIIQELLSNIAKHAAASLVEVSFSLHDDKLIVFVNDNGKGFDSKKKQKGIGLQNIQERITAIQGMFTIDSNINAGTNVILEIPIQNTNNNE